MKILIKKHENFFLSQYSKIVDLISIQEQNLLEEKHNKLIEKIQELNRKINLIKNKYVNNKSKKTQSLPTPKLNKNNKSNRRRYSNFI